MPNREHALLDRTVRRQRGVIAGLGLLLAFLAGAGLGGRPHATPGAPEGVVLEPRITHYTAGGDRLYRIWDNGTVEYLVVDFANGSVEGIPGWARVHIDRSLSRDRMGNEIRVRIR